MPTAKQPHHRTDNIAGSLRALLVCALLTCAWLLLAPSAAEAAVPITLERSFAGNINYTMTGGTLRTNRDGVDSCAVTTGPVTAPLAGIPAASTIRAAYLYWAGSHNGTPDYDVTFEGTNITADRTFTEIFPYAGNNYNYFAGFKNVTAQVAGKGNGTYSFSNLTVYNGNPHCGSAAVLSGWAMIVIYENAGEPLRVINVFDGLEYYRGSAITLSPSNFQIPSSGPIDGKHGIITWEGDVGNSASLNGFNENLTFNGTPLTDADNPLNNQFNSSINVIGSGPDTTWGVDVDDYNVTPYLVPGSTSVTTVYSSGGDLVLLSAEVISVTNDPVADLAITKSHSGNFVYGVNGVFTLTVTNNGPLAEPGTVTVTDTLPAGLSYVSSSGTGWTADLSALPTITWTHAGPLANGASLPPITLTVAVGAAAYPSVANTATVSHPLFDNHMENNSATDTVTVLGANLSTSTKSVVDLNGGDADPGDVLRYTITLNESAGQAGSGIRVTDNIPANLTGFTVVSLPPGATDSSLPAPGGANGTGYLDIGNISIAASGTRTIVFDVTIAGGTPAGTVINNVAAVTVTGGTGGTPPAPPVTVAGGSLPGSGNKPLYLYDSASTPALKLSRTPMPTAAATFVAIPRGNTTTVWTESPALQLPVTISSGVIPVQLWLSTNNTRTYSIPVTLRCGAANVATLTQNTALVNGAAAALFTFNLPLAAAYTCTPPNNWSLAITNTQGAGAGARDIRVYPAPSVGNTSNVSLPSQSVININNSDIVFYDAPYPGGASVASVTAGTTVYARATVSDPFGSYDISGATVTLTDSAGTVRVNGAAMTEVFDSGAATKIYQYTYAVPAGGPAGNWTARVVAREGSEGTVTDYALKGLTVTVPLPSLTLLKSAAAYSDPVNGTTSPKAIPGAAMRYTLLTTNFGAGTADANSLVFVDPIPADTALYVGNLGQGKPVFFTDGAIASGLAAANVVDSYSSKADCNSYTYTPVPDGAGYDPNVCRLRVQMNGTLNGASGGNNPSFSLMFQVRID